MEDGLLTYDIRMDGNDPSMEKAYFEEIKSLFQRVYHP